MPRKRRGAVGGAWRKSTPIPRRRSRQRPLLGDLFGPLALLVERDPTGAARREDARPGLFALLIGRRGRVIHGVLVAAAAERVGSEKEPHRLFFILILV